MSDLISRSVLMKDIVKRFGCRPHIEVGNKCEYIHNIIDDQPTIEAVPLSEIYRCIAGHSNYHGDNILAAMTCIAEGKEVKPIKPIEAVEVVHGEWIKDSCPDVPEGFSYDSNWKCSKCKSWVRYRYNFCPNCGADMRKGGAE